MIVALIGVIIGALITWTMTFYLKAREIKISARNHAFLLSFSLAEQLSSLANVLHFIDLIKEQKAHRKFSFIASFFPLKNDSIVKILEYEKTLSFPNADTTIQKLTIIQRTYADLCLFIDKYNISLSPNTLAVMKEKRDKNNLDSHYKGLELEITSNFEGICMKADETRNYIINTKKDFDNLCEKIFNENDGFCEKIKEFFEGTVKKNFKGYKFKPPIVKDKIIKAVEI